MQIFSTSLIAMIAVHELCNPKTASGEQEGDPETEKQEEKRKKNDNNDISLQHKHTDY